MIISVKRLSAILAFILVDVSTFGGESEDLVEWFSPSNYEDEDLIDKLWKVELCCDFVLWKHNLWIGNYFRWVHTDENRISRRYS